MTAVWSVSGLSALIVVACVWLLRGELRDALGSWSSFTSVPRPGRSR